MFLCRTTHLCHHHRLRTSILSLWKWSASPARAIHFDLLGHVASPREQRHPLMGHQLCLLDSLVSTCRAVRLTAMTKSSKVYLCIFQRRFSSSLQPCGSIQWLQMERGPSGLHRRYDGASSEAHFGWSVLPGWIAQSRGMHAPDQWVQRKIEARS